MKKAPIFFDILISQGSEDYLEGVSFAIMQLNEEGGIYDHYILPYIHDSSNSQLYETMKNVKSKLRPFIIMLSNDNIYRPDTHDTPDPTKSFEPFILSCRESRNRVLGFPDTSNFFSIADVADAEVRTLRKYLIDNLHITSDIVVVTDNEYSIPFVASFKVIDKPEIDFTEISLQDLKKDMSYRAAVLFVKNKWKEIFSLREELNFSGPILTTASLEEYRMPRNRLSEIQGIYYTFFPIEEKFVKSFKSCFGHEPNIKMAGGYDITRIAAKAIIETTYNPEAMKHYLHSHTFKYSLGSIFFDDKGVGVYPFDIERNRPLPIIKEVKVTKDTEKEPYREVMNL